MGRWKISMAQRRNVDTVMDDGEWRSSREVSRLIGIDCKHLSASVNYWLARRCEQNKYTSEGRGKNKKYRKVII
tara:strand:+ start:715 stop:936 length:222 start_codon:yes stop_codon:yes gene_type:complete